MFPPEQVKDGAGGAEGGGGDAGGAGGGEGEPKKKGKKVRKAQSRTKLNKGIAVLFQSNNQAALEWSPNWYTGYRLQGRINYHTQMYSHDHGGFLVSFVRLFLFRFIARFFLSTACRNATAICDW